MIYTNKLTDMDGNINIDVNNILVLENGLIKNPYGKIIDIIVGNDIYGLGLETLESDNEIEVLGTSLAQATWYNFNQEPNDNNWANYKILVKLKSSIIIEDIVHKQLGIKMKIETVDGSITENILYHNEIDSINKILKYNKISYDNPGFRKLSFWLVSGTSANTIIPTEIDKIIIQLYTFENSRATSNVIVKSYPVDPIVTGPGESWYNSTENVWKFTLLDANGNTVVKTFATMQDLSSAIDNTIWMTAV